MLIRKTVFKDRIQKIKGSNLIFSQIFASVNRWQSAFLACTLKVFGEGADMGEGDQSIIFANGVLLVLMSNWETRYHTRLLQSWYEQFRVRGIRRYCIKVEGLKGCQEMKATNKPLF